MNDSENDNEYIIKDIGIMPGRHAGLKSDRARLFMAISNALGESVMDERHLDLGGNLALSFLPDRQTLHPYLLFRDDDGDDHSMPLELERMIAGYGMQFYQAFMQKLDNDVYGGLVEVLKTSAERSLEDTRELIEKSREPVVAPSGLLVKLFKVRFIEQIRRAKEQAQDTEYDLAVRHAAYGIVADGLSGSGRKGFTHIADLLRGIQPELRKAHNLFAGRNSELLPNPFDVELCTAYMISKAYGGE